MKNFMNLWRRELMAYFISPAAYVTMLLVLIVTGLGFGLQAILSRGVEIRLDILVFWMPTLWLMVMIVATVLTMHLFAEEKRTGSIEMLMTAPVTEIEVVLGKYAAAMSMYVMVFLPTCFYVFLLQRLSTGIDHIDSGAMLSGYLIFALISSLYTAVGLLVSSVSRSQIVAAILSFAVLCGMFVLFGALGYVFSDPGIPVLQYMNPFRHIAEASRGILDLRIVLLYLSSIGLTLFLTVKVVESRRWL